MIQVKRTLAWLPPASSPKGGVSGEALQKLVHLASQNLMCEINHSKACVTANVTSRLSTMGKLLTYSTSILSRWKIGFIALVTNCKRGFNTEAVSLEYDEKKNSSEYL